MSSQGIDPRHWLVPDWPAAHRVKALCTTRAGGTSRPPYESMNLGDHVGDDPQDVQFNRDELQRCIGVRPVFMRQVHGMDVLMLGADCPEGEVADAAVATTPGMACTIMVADCLPVLLSSQSGTVVAAAHAGWRGLASGVVQATVQAMSLSAQDACVAWLGPCIGPGAFEVGEEVRDAFAQSGWVDAENLARCFVSTASAAGQNKFLANLPGLTRLALRSCGVEAISGNDGGASWCTMGNPLRFFSHRRDSAVRGGQVASTGRMAACVWLD